MKQDVNIFNYDNPDEQKLIFCQFLYKLEKR